MPSFSKQSLRDELLTLMAADLAAVERAQHDTHAGATHEEAKAEDDKDTRALEQTYLARGQAQRVEELRAGIHEVRVMDLRPFTEEMPIGQGALVTVDEEGKEQRFFIAPHAGGTMLANGRVQVVTPKSPLGQTLLGAAIGDDCDLDLPGGTRSFSIMSLE
jgi:transcription elongation GreA/GreB family factor